ncbi:hypothetical protein [Phenylobacterium sp.]|uniref:hypothetical protein n=1 Tax=Phenylobacterium sp. TaxID=1871053 RepID=UPI002BAE5303|nr:hypothetical protein [Phenylobacterium sp.]HVI33356.1 hypothetical protein [Phenylobacterium sp.]
MAPPRPKPPAPAAVTFRNAIERAVQEGVAPDDMTLHLTLRDDADLKRDRTIAVQDISFDAGVMRFLGVKVATGGVTVSKLDLGGSAEAGA